MNHAPSTSLWRPGNLLAACGVGLLKASARLPLRWTRPLGAGIGAVAAALFPFRRRVGLVNLRLCFPELDEGARRRLLRRHYQAMGMGIFELAAAWYQPDERIRGLGTVRGLEHLRAVKDSGRGALLLTAHFTTLEICGRLLLCHHPFSCLYRRPNQPVIAAAMTAARAALMRRVIHFDRLPELVRALREGDFVWYAPDQGRTFKYSAILPFFGVPAVTNTATGRIARMGNAAVIPFLGWRRPDGRYEVEIFPELTDLPEDPAAEGVLINRLIEAFVRKAPDQYFWLHRRFKHRGPEYPDAYAK